MKKIVPSSTLGNAEILKQHKVAFLCSRKCPANIVLLTMPAKKSTSKNSHLVNFLLISMLYQPDKAPNGYLSRHKFNRYTDLLPVILYFLTSSFPASYASLRAVGCCRIAPFVSIPKKLRVLCSGTLIVLKNAFAVASPH